MILVTTMGGQPQIVTFTLDALRRRGEAIDQVVVVYLAGAKRYQRAFQQLSAEFAGDRYDG
jgi:CRISPR-associated protein Csx14